MTVKEKLHRIIDEIPENEAEQILSYVEARQPQPSPQTLSPEEFRKKLSEIGKASKRTTPLPDEALSRETMYD